MIRSRRPAGLAPAGAVTLSGAVLTGPAQAAAPTAAAAPSADTPVATTQLNHFTPTSIRYRWAGPSGFRYGLGALPNAR